MSVSVSMIEILWPLRQQRLAHDLPEAAEADDQHVAVEPIRLLDTLHRLLRRGEQRAAPACVSGVSTIEMMTVAVKMACCSARDETGRSRRGEQHESELAALRHQHGALQRLRRARLEHAREDEDRAALDDHVGDHAQRDDLPVRRNHVEIERHAHRKEEQPEQDAAERLDVGLELMPEGRGREQHAGEERAHRHRQPAALEQQRRAEHDQQRRGRHHLARLRVGEEAEHRIEDPAADED